MDARIRVTGEPFFRTLILCMLSGSLVVVSFTSGWLVRYSFLVGLPRAMLEFETRLLASLESMKRVPVVGVILTNLVRIRQDHMGFGLFSYEFQEPGEDPAGPDGPALKIPRIRPSVRPTPAATARPTPASSPRIHPLDETRREILALLRRVTYGRDPKKFTEADLQKLDEHLRSWTRLGPAEVLGIMAQVARMVYLPDGLRRRANLGILTHRDVARSLKVPEGAAERIVMGWELDDLDQAFRRGGIKALRELARGRPGRWFLDLDRTAGDLARCWLNMERIDEAAGTGSAPPGGGPAKLASSLACPGGGGSYGYGAATGASCPNHGSRENPGAGAVAYALYLAPVDRASRLLAHDDVTGCLEALHENRRVYPRNAMAVYQLAEVHFRLKDHQSLYDLVEAHRETFPGEVRMGFLRCLSAYALGRKDETVAGGREALQARFGAPPARLSTHRDFYLQRDRIQEVVQSAADGLLFEDFSFKPEERCASRVCLVTAADVSRYISDYLRNYPRNHPLLPAIEERLRKAEELKGRARGPTLAKLLAQEKVFLRKKEEILGDSSRKHLWKALLASVSRQIFEPCPDGGGYRIHDGGRLDCTAHPGLFETPLPLEGIPEAAGDERAQLESAVLLGLLNGDRPRKACFELQKEYLAGKGTRPPDPAAPIDGATLPSGRELRCPSRGSFRLESAGPEPRVVCDRHGSMDAWFGN